MQSMIAKTGIGLKSRLALLALVGVFTLMFAYFVSKEREPVIPKEWTGLHPGMTRAEMAAATTDAIFHYKTSNSEVLVKKQDDGHVQLEIAYDEAGLSKHAQVTFMTHKSAIYKGPDALF